MMMLMILILVVVVVMIWLQYWGPHRETLPKCFCKYIEKIHRDV